MMHISLSNLVAVALLGCISTCNRTVDLEGISLAKEFGGVDRQSQTWLVARYRDKIVLVCRSNDGGRWALLNDGTWKTYVPKDSSKASVLKKSPPPELADIQAPRETLTEHDGWLVLYLDPIWREIPECSAVLVGVKDHLCITFRSPESQENNDIVVDLASGRFVVLGQGSSYPAIISILHNSTDQRDHPANSE